MTTKTEKAVNLLKDGRFKEALAIFKTFRIGFTKDEKRSMEIASETLNGSGAFYESIGVDTKEEIRKAKELLKKKYLC